MKRHADLAVKGLLGLIVVVSTLGTAISQSAQQDNFEKCYGISEVGKNDGWEKDINPGKYLSETDFDGKAWIFVETDTCLKRGGRLEPFAGVGTPGNTQRN